MKQRRNARMPGVLLL